MTVIRWQPWQEVEALRRQFDQMVEEFAPVSREGLLTSVNRAVRTPAVELKTTDTDVILRAEVPGIAAKDLSVEVTREAVSIAGEFRSETKEDDHAFYRSEFRYGNFRRIVPLPAEVDNEAVKAEFQDGILTLTLPKLNEAKSKVVKVNLGEDPVAPVSVQ
jgi:HSP20 family protein